MSDFPKATRADIDFQGFQSQLSTFTGERGPVWDIRDALYGVVAGGSRKRCSKLDAFPLGWLPLFLRAYILGWLRSRVSLSHTKPASHHFFIPDPAENHFDRLASLFRSSECRSNRKIWYVRQSAASKLTVNEKFDSSDITHTWVRSFRPSDLILALGTVSLLKRIPIVRNNRTHVNNLVLYITKFHTARRFWKQQFETCPPTAIYATYEKNFLAKSFFLEAREMGVLRRVFWLHGLAHESLQATFSTEMWCMRSAEASSMRSLLPPDCITLHVPSPRVRRLMETAGVRVAASKRSLTSLNFLVLGTGNDPVFTEAMREADLARLREIQISLGDSVNWRFRPHPGAMERYRIAVGAANLNMESFSVNQLDEDLKWCDAILAPYSSVSVEAHEIGRTVFWSLPSSQNLYGVSGLVDEGIGQRIDPVNAVTLVHEHFPAYQR